MGTHSLSSTPLQLDESSFFDNPISLHTKNETSEELAYLDPEVTPLPSIPYLIDFYISFDPL